MKPIIRKSIATFYPQGFIDSNNAPFIVLDEDIRKIVELKYQENIDEEKNVRMALISLKRVIFFNVKGLMILMNKIKKIREDVPNINVGLCDYSSMHYDVIRRFYDKDLDFSLYKTFKVATLFTTPSIGQESILVWNENYEQRNVLSIELFERGYNPIVVHGKKDFEEHFSRDGAYDDVVYETFIGSVAVIPFARVSGSAIIYTLTGYLDTTIDNQFDFAYHQKALRTGFKLFIFDMKNIVSMNVKAMGFFDRMVKDLKSYEGTVCIANLKRDSTLERMAIELEKLTIRLFLTLDELLNDKELLIELGGIIHEEHHEKSVTRGLVNHLPSFINATVSTLEMMIGISAVKTGRIKIKDLEVKNGGKKLASSIGFFGDLEGIIILIFPFELAKKSCSMMLGEDIHSLSEVLDALAEFVNVIAGRVKTHLAEQNTTISITLPRTYSSADELTKTLKLNKGVQVDLNFHNDTFTFFLTR